MQFEIWEEVAKSNHKKIIKEKLKDAFVLSPQRHK